MKTLDENGNVISDTPDAVFPFGLQKHTQLLQHLHGLHSQLTATPVNKTTVLTAVGLVAAIGAAWWLNSRSGVIEYDEVNEGESDE